MQRFHGLFSIFLVSIALITGFISIFLSDYFWSIIYLIIVLTSSFLIIFIYCRKCPHVKDNSCKHVIVGPIAKLFPPNDSSSYTIFEIFLVVFSILSAIVFPQFWLWNESILLYTFCAFLLLALLDILIFVCKGCFNINCILCPNKNGDE